MTNMTITNLLSVSESTLFALEDVGPFVKVLLGRNVGEEDGSAANVIGGAAGLKLGDAVGVTIGSSVKMIGNDVGDDVGVVVKVVENAVGKRVGDLGGSGVS